MSGQVDVLTSRSDLAAARSAMRGRVAVVMTMGALHEGHGALLRAARAGAGHVLATIFVNPLQFGPGEDLDRYPRTLDADLRLLGQEGVDAVFAPSAEQIYPDGTSLVRIDPGPQAEILEGAHRPGHFGGVLTVVHKLFGLTRPDVAYFGEKDYQQLVLIRRMVVDLELPVEIAAVATVREGDGLARSSRNRYLTTEQRVSARSLSAALRAGAAAAAAGEDPAGVLAHAGKELAVGGVETDYLELTDPGLGPAPKRGDARLLVAARVGSTRLIDNAPIRLAPGVDTPGVGR